MSKAGLAAVFTFSILGNVGASAHTAVVQQPNEAQDDAREATGTIEARGGTPLQTNLIEESYDQAIEDIVVTATRREARLQSIPLAVTAVSGEGLQNAGVNNTEQIAQVAPNLVVVQNSGQTQFNLRGVSSRGAYAGDENGVAVYLDGIYQPVPYSGLFDLLEVERVEVLRGPQGTLFGRNATGGLVNVITPAPSFNTQTHLRGTYGRFNLLQMQGYATTGLTEKIAIDFAGSYFDDNGYVRDLIRGGKLGDRRSYMARSKLLLEASDTAKFVFSLYYTQNDDQSSVLHQAVGGRTVAALIPGTVVSTRPNTAAVGNPMPGVNTRQFVSSLQSTFELGSVDLEATISYTKSRLASFTDFDYTAARVQEIRTVQKDQIGLAEVRLVSNSDGPLEWTAGVFGFLTQNKYAPFIVFVNGNALFTHMSRNKTKSLAPFAEGTYYLTDALNLTVGGRFSYEKRDFDFSRLTGTVRSAGEASNSWKSFTPRASVQYVFSDTFNVYATWSRGFKSGLFDTPSNSLVPINEERIDAYEIGFKSDPSRSIRLNASAFYYRYDDLQITGLDPESGTSRLLNAAEASIWGVEGELTVKPATGLNIRAAAGYLHTNFDRFPNATVTVSQPNFRNTSTTRDISGGVLLRSPKYTTSLGADYSAAVSFGRVGTSVSVYYSTRYFFEPAYRLSQPAYAMANGQIWIEPADRFRVSFWVENLANEVIKRTALPSGPGDFATYQKPRTYGITMDKRF